MNINSTVPESKVKEMEPANIKKIAKMQKLLEHIAYYSLALDFAITVATLISLNIKRPLESIIFYLNLALSVVVVIAALIFVVIFFLSHYDKIIDKFALRYARNMSKKKVHIKYKR
jgi:hypothetical protein